MAHLCRQAATIDLDEVDHGFYDDDLALSHDQVAEVERRIADPNRNFLSLSDTRDRLRHFGV